MTEQGGTDPNQQPGWAPPPGYSSGGQQPGWGAPPPPPGYGGGYGPPPGYGQQQPYYGAPPNDGKAVGALVASIMSWVVCPVVPAIVALVLASSSSRSIMESGGRLGGAGMNTAARIISWINIIVSIGFLLVFFAAIGSVETGSTDPTFPYPTFE